MTSTRIECPLECCQWVAVVTTPNVAPGALASVFGTGVVLAVATNQHHQEVEDRLRAHLMTHSVVEWAETVGKLKRYIAALEDELNEVK